LRDPEFSRVDNMQKRVVRCYAGTDDTGRIQYELFPVHVLNDSLPKLFYMLTGKNPLFPDAPVVPSPYWTRFQKATATKARPGGVKGSVKLLRKIVKLCPCFKRPYISQCVCPICATFVAALRLLNRIHPRLYRAAGEKASVDGAAPTQACNQCHGLCHIGGSYRKLSLGASTATNILLCPPKRVSTLELRVRDGDGRPIHHSDKLDSDPLVYPAFIPGSKRMYTDTDGYVVQPFAIPSKRCFANNCKPTVLDAGAGCGWDHVFRDMKNVEFIDLNNERVTERGCPVLLSEEPVTWYEFQEVVTSSASGGGEADPDWADDGSSQTRTEWLPQRGTMAQFMRRVRRWSIKYFDHLFRVKLHRGMSKLFEDTFVVRRALGCYKSDMYASLFASSTERHPAFREIDVLPPSSAVVPLPFDSASCHPAFFGKRVRSVSGLDSPLWDSDALQARVKGTLSGGTDFAARFEAMRENVVTCEFGESVADAVYVWGHGAYGERTADLPAGRRQKSLFKRGIKVTVRQHVQCVFAMSEVRGSAAYHATAFRDQMHIFKHGTVPDNSKAEWFYKGQRLMGGDRTNYGVLPVGIIEATGPLCIIEGIECVDLDRDGCTGQYQGLHNFRFIQTSKALNKVEHREVRAPPGHGKGIHDSAGAGPGRAIAGGARAGASAPPGVRGVVLHLVQIKPRPTNDKQYHLWAHDQPYLYAYISKSAIDSMLANAEKGYKQSSLDFEYLSVGETVNTSELRVRRDWCICAPCAVRDFAKCEMRGVFGVAGSKFRSVTIRASAAVERRQTRGAGELQEFAKKVKVGQLLVTRVHADDASEEDCYFLCKVTRKPWQLTKKQVFGGNEYGKGWWVFRMHWFKFDSEDASGNRKYTLLNTVRQGITFNLNAVARNLALDRLKIGPATSEGSKRVYTLPSALNEAITRYCCLSS